MKIEFEEEKRKIFQNTTLMVKTFQRPDCLDRLLESIDQFYGKYGEDLKIIIGDDSSEQNEPLQIRNKVAYYKLPFDTGSGATRNYLLDEIDTEYFIYLDDDYVFTKNTRFEELITVLEENEDIDIVAGCCLEQGKEMRNFCGLLVPSNKKGYLAYKRGRQKGTRCRGRLELFDLVENFWAGRTEEIKQVKWRSALKTIEHIVFLVDCMFSGLTVAKYLGINIDHFQQMSESYRMLRYRYKDLTFIDDMLRKSYGIKLDRTIY
jgi:hypothetical protein